MGYHRHTKHTTGIPNGVKKNSQKDHKAKSIPYNIIEKPMDAFLNIEMFSQSIHVLSMNVFI